MNITPKNYQIYFQPYVDNKLSLSERKSVENFLEANPEYKTELDLLLQSNLQHLLSIGLSQEKNIYDINSIVNNTAIPGQNEILESEEQNDISNNDELEILESEERNEISNNDELETLREAEVENEAGNNSINVENIEGLNAEEQNTGNSIINSNEIETPIAGHNKNVFNSKEKNLNKSIIPANRPSSSPSKKNNKNIFWLLLTIVFIVCACILLALKSVDNYNLKKSAQSTIIYNKPTKQKIPSLYSKGTRDTPSVNKNATGTLTNLLNPTINPPSAYSKKNKFNNKALAKMFKKLPYTKQNNKNKMGISGYYIIIDKSDHELHVFDKKGWYATYPIAFGTKDLNENFFQDDRNPSNDGFKIMLKKDHPKWGPQLFIKAPSIKADGENASQNNKKEDIIAIYATKPGDEWVIDNFYNWTDGGISVKYAEMKDLFSYIKVGTPVMIQY